MPIFNFKNSNMKNLIVLLAVLTASLVNAQAFIGSMDNKFQVGANIQDDATGIYVSYDYGLGPNISVGVSSAYALSIDDAIDADFGDRFDIKGLVLDQILLYGDIV